MASSRATGPAAAAGLLAVALAAAVAGCGVSADADPPASGVGGTVTVFAAASLTEPFTQLGKDFETAYPGTTVVLSFAGSATLAQQVNEGAPVDVFAAADPTAMQLVADGGLAEVTPTIFVRNQLVIAVAPGNPLGITGLADLPGLTVALCAEQVPCGRAAQRALDAAGVALTPATLERDVKAALAKTELGEVDAALVYRTDVQASDRVAGVEFPESAAAVNDYPISALGGAPNPAAAAAFVEFVLSEAGQAVLAGAGFTLPS